MTEDGSQSAVTTEMNIYDTQNNSDKLHRTSHMGYLDKTSCSAINLALFKCYSAIKSFIKHPERICSAA